MTLRYAFATPFRCCRYATAMLPRTLRQLRHAAHCYATAYDAGAILRLIMLLFTPLSAICQRADVICYCCCFTAAAAVFRYAMPRRCSIFSLYAALLDAVAGGAYVA